jgi:hypothetical protein
VITSGGVATFKPRLAWQAQYDNGARALGPLTLFAGNLYYSIVKPPQANSGDSCAGLDTLSDLHKWGFLTSENGVDVKDNASFPPRPATMTPTDTTRDEFDKEGLTSKVRDIHGIVAGVGLRQLPSCSTVGPAAGNLDAFLGYGQSATIGSSQPGKFQIVIQPSGGKSKPNALGAQEAPVTSVDVSPPNTTVRVDSWAPIIP